jgi:hypothetical protein
MNKQEIEKAIETLKDMKGVFGTRSHKQYSLSALDLAISAFWQRYCSNCGQKLDWSVEE